MLSLRHCQLKSYCARASICANLFETTPCEMIRHILGPDLIKFLRKPKPIYNQLTGSNIRLLRLLPGRSDIKFELVDVSLEDSPDFEAISYVWGLQHERQPVFCQDQIVYISVNLAQALRGLRNTKKSRLLWADSICINQHDVSEKGHQVQMMGEIYKKASRVIIWLGGSDIETQTGDTWKAVQVLKYVHSQISNPQHGTKDVLKPGDLTLGTLDEHMRARRIDGTWRALDEFFKRQWWLRIWCVQEAVLARKTIIVSNVGNAVEVQALTIPFIIPEYSPKICFQHR
jgi:hypothetical protein